MSDSTRGAREHSHRYGRPWFWALVAVAIAALFASGIAVIIHWWDLLWACAALVVVAVAASKAVGVMDDTVVIDPGPSARIAVSGRDSAAAPRVARLSPGPAAPRFPATAPE